MERIKRRTAILLISILFLTILAIVPIVGGNNVSDVKAEELPESFVDLSNIETTEELIIVMESGLQEQGKSIVSVLEEQKEVYEEELINVDIEMQDVVSAKLEEVTKAINDVPLYGVNDWKTVSIVKERAFRRKPIRSFFLRKNAKKVCKKSKRGLQTGKECDKIIVRGKNWERRQGNENENEINIKTDFDEHIGRGDAAGRDFYDKRL